MRHLVKPLWVLLALFFLFEAWLWSHLQPIVGWIVARIAWPRLRARLASTIEHLSPYPTLLIFLIPVVLLFPLKLAGLWMLAKGFWLGAMGTLVLAKIVSMGVTAFIFDLTRPKLLRLPWFRWLYEHVLMLLAWAHRQTDPLKERVRLWWRESLDPVKRRLRRIFWLVSPGRAGRFLRHVRRIRHRMQRLPRAGQVH